jgi:hypothetical protein
MTRPPSFSRITIFPSLSAISCSSTSAAAGEVAETTVTSLSVLLTSVPKAAVMPLSADFTHGSVIESGAAGAVSAERDGWADAADGLADAAVEPPSDAAEPHAATENESRESASTPETAVRRENMECRLHGSHELGKRPAHRPVTRRAARANG